MVLAVSFCLQTSFVKASNTQLNMNFFKQQLFVALFCIGSIAAAVVSPTPSPGYLPEGARCKWSGYAKVPDTELIVSVGSQALPIL